MGLVLTTMNVAFIVTFNLEGRNDYNFLSMYFFTSKNVQTTN